MVDYSPSMNLYPKVTYYDSKGYIKETCFWGGVGETIQRREMPQNKGKTTGIKAELWKTQG